MLSARRHNPLPVALALCAATIGGCGSKTDYANRPRPPAPIVVTASISDAAVSISPRSIGAGPIQLIITNQSSASQQVTLETSGVASSRAGIRQQTGPINPRDTATLSATVVRGRYSVAVKGIGSAGLVVGKQRPSAQNDLLQP